MGKRRKVSPHKYSKKGIKKIYYLFIFASIVIIGAVIYRINSPTIQCANSISCIKDLSGKIDEHAKTGEFMGKTVEVPKLPFLLGYYPQAVLGESTDVVKRIDIDLTNQKLYAFENNKVVFEFPVSTGKWSPTPTGDFKIWIKLRATRMNGGDRSIGTYYDLPNVPFTMFFYNDQIPKSRGYGIHGAYWHNNFGNPMSHGCVNMRIEDAGTLYSWADPPSSGFTTYADVDAPGTLVKIYGETPRE